jgi:hypothetical protein
VRAAVTPRGTPASPSTAARPAATAAAGADPAGLASANLADPGGADFLAAFVGPALAASGRPILPAVLAAAADPRRAYAAGRVAALVAAALP